MIATVRSRQVSRAQRGLLSTWFLRALCDRSQRSLRCKVSQDIKSKVLNRGGRRELPRRTRSTRLFRGLFGQNQRHRLIVGLDGDPQHLPSGKRLWGNRKAHDDSPLRLTSDIDFAFTLQRSPGELLQRWKSLIVAIEVDGRNCIATRYSARCYKLSLNVMHPE